MSKVVGQRCPRRLSTITKGRELLADSAQEILDKKPQVSIALVGGVPTHRDGAVLSKVHQRRRFAIAGRRRDERQLTLKAALNSPAQPWSVQEASRVGYKYLGTDKGQFRNNHCFADSNKAIRFRTISIPHIPTAAKSDVRI
jgi:hypothetical protein